MQRQSMQRRNRASINKSSEEDVVTDDSNIESFHAAPDGQLPRNATVEAAQSPGASDDAMDGAPRTPPDTTDEQAHDASDDVPTWDHAGDAEADAAHDGVIPRLAGMLDMSRGDEFVQRLVDTCGDDTEGDLAAPLQGLRSELASHTAEAAAFEQFAAAVEDLRLDEKELACAASLLGALTARIIVRDLADGGATADTDACRHLLRQAIAAAGDLLANRRAGGLQPLPLVARHLARHALRRGMTPMALADALPRITARLSTEPGLMRRLTQTATTRRRQTGRGSWGTPRRLVLHSPVEITILAR
jgi:hypothetical protein